MTPEAQRIAIAEADGWIRDNRCDCWRKPSEGEFAVAFLSRSHALRNLPDYLADLNAMHEAERAMTPMQRVNYVLALQRIVVPPGCSAFADCIFATAAKKAEAFLRSLNLWEDAK